jgi:hypothetical protein
MDDVFQILLYAIIIISFLSSLFKKKKPEQKPKEHTKERTSISFPYENSKDVKIETESGSNYDVDIMKEFERFFKVETEKEATNELERSNETESTQPSLERSTPIEIQQRQKDLERSFNKPTESEHKYTNFWERKKSDLEKKTSKIDSSIEKQAAEFEKHLPVHEQAASEISKKIRARLKDPSTLKDYIIISELMGKPKALRH